VESQTLDNEDWYGGTTDGGKDRIEPVRLTGTKLTPYA